MTVLSGVPTAASCFSLEWRDQQGAVVKRGTRRLTNRTDGALVHAAVHPAFPRGLGDRRSLASPAGRIRVENDEFRPALHGRQSPASAPRRLAEATARAGRAFATRRRARVFRAQGDLHVQYRRLACSTIACVALIAGCGNDEPTDAPAVFRGTYAITTADGAKRGSITFDATTFTAAVDAKAFKGSYRYNDSAKTLRLTDTITGTKTVWTIGSLEASKANNGASPSSVRPKDALLAEGDPEQQRDLLNKSETALLVTTTLAKIKDCSAQASTESDSQAEADPSTLASVRPRDQAAGVVGALLGALCPGSSAGTSDSSSSSTPGQGPSDSSGFTIARTNEPSPKDTSDKALYSSTAKRFKSFGLNVEILKKAYSGSIANENSEAEAKALYDAVVVLTGTPTFKNILAPAYKKFPSHSVTLVQTNQDDPSTWSSIPHSDEALAVTMTVRTIPSVKMTITPQVLAIAIAHELGHNVAVADSLRTNPVVAKALTTLVPARTALIEQVPIAIELFTGDDLGGLRISNPARYVEK